MDMPSEYAFAYPSLAQYQDCYRDIGYLFGLFQDYGHGRTSIKHTLSLDLVAGTIVFGKHPACLEKVDIRQAGRKRMPSLSIVH